MSEEHAHDTGEGLGADIEAAARRAERNVKIAWAVAMVALLVLGGYLFVAYRHIDSTSKPGVVVSFVHNRMMQNLPRVGEAVERHLERKAPAYVDRAGEEALQSPRLVRRAGQEFLLRNLEQRFDTLESELKQTIAAQVEALDAEIDAETEEGKRRQLKALLSKLASRFGDRTRELVDERYEKFYEPRAEAAREQLRRLVRGVHLSEKEKLHRRLLITVLALQQRLRDADDGSAPQLPFPKGLFEQG